MTSPLAVSMSWHIAVAADGISIRYGVTNGAQTGVPILLVHGFGTDATTNWVISGWVRTLHTRLGRPIIVVDLRGHGGSGRPRDPALYRIHEMVSDLRLVLDASVPANTEFDAIGYSLGARLVAELAAVLEAEARSTTVPPQRLRRIVLGGSDGEPLLQSVRMEQFLAAFNGGEVPADTETRRVVRIAHALPSNDPAALSALVQGLSVSDPHMARRAPDPSQPTLLALGGKDDYLPRARQWAADLPAGALVEIPGRDHLTAVPSAIFRTAAAEFLRVAREVHVILPEPRAPRPLG
ncbi:alpha/beta fold hydrolase [Nakamurella antarctica]|uniref:Alpha/beta fold hydrolase n=1 Tax=Nakamurella antarctica TaxID=1902245 RepID=A0A3G8ZJ56_9ACTN|nr:alpha/beta fold hydrolase [Nakamurella antarctica]AZI57303.1 alpha/beta fold hydrolase [Nakamurella antarctica]